MKIDEIRELVRLMVENELAELDITEGENKIRLKRTGAAEVVSLVPSPGAPPGAAPSAAAGLRTAGAAAPAPPAENLLEIKSPMVGTFYAAASPDSEPYVGVGTRVAEDTVVCIVEAMKVMNEIKAECAGAIVEVCVKNAAPVEYGQVLFKVRPS
jgi:acetyl-CoA carboxylase biotin carboxyl carrier protein